MLSPPLMLLLEELVIIIITLGVSPRHGLVKPDVNKMADRKRITFHPI